MDILFPLEELKQLNQTLREINVVITAENVWDKSNKRILMQANLGKVLGRIIRYPNERLDTLFGFQFDYRTEMLQITPRLLDYLPNDVRLQKLVEHRAQMLRQRLRKNKIK